MTIAFQLRKVREFMELRMEEDEYSFHDYHAKMMKQSFDSLRFKRPDQIKLVDELDKEMIAYHKAGKIKSKRDYDRLLKSRPAQQLHPYHKSHIVAGDKKLNI